MNSLYKIKVRKDVYEVSGAKTVPFVSAGTILDCYGCIRKKSNYSPLFLVYVNNEWLWAPSEHFSPAIEGIDF